MRVVKLRHDREYYVSNLSCFLANKVIWPHVKLDVELGSKLVDQIYDALEEWFKAEEDGESEGMTQSEEMMADHIIDWLSNARKAGYSISFMQGFRSACMKMIALVVPQSDSDRIAVLHKLLNDDDEDDNATGESEE